MIQIGHDQKLPIMSKFLSEIARVEHRAGISVRDYLGFGNHSQVGLKYFKDGDYHFIGELNSSNELHGKGISIWSSGIIDIQYWDNGLRAPGNYLTIHRDGRFYVGEYY